MLDVAPSQTSLTPNQTQSVATVHSATRLVVIFTKHLQDPMPNFTRASTVT